MNILSITLLHLIQYTVVGYSGSEIITCKLFQQIILKFKYFCPVKFFSQLLSKKLRKERRWVEAVVVVEGVGLDGVDALGGPMMMISGKKHNKQVLLC